MTRTKRRFCRLSYRHPNSGPGVRLRRGGGGWVRVGGGGGGSGGGGGDSRGGGGGKDVYRRWAHRVRVWSQSEGFVEPDVAIRGNEFDNYFPPIPPTRTPETLIISDQFDVSCF